MSPSHRPAASDVNSTPTPTPMIGAARPHLSRTVGFVLAGGEGRRLHELTQTQSKAALHLTGATRLVDFAMSNLWRAGIGKVLVATQYCPATLARHLAAVWQPGFPEAGAMLRDAKTMALSGRYAGTADAVRVNVAALDALSAREVVVISASGVGRIAHADLIAAHRASGAMVTVAALAVPLAQAAGALGLQAGANGRLRSCTLNAALPEPLAQDPDKALIALGCTVFSWPWLRALLLSDPVRMLQFDDDVLPLAAAEGVAAVWRLPPLRPGSAAYWQDIATLDDFRQTGLAFETANTPCEVPLLPVIGQGQVPDAALSLNRFAATSDIGGVRLCAPLSHPEDRRRWSVLDQTLLMPGARVAPAVRLTRCIVAPGTSVAEGLTVGEDPLEDARWFRVTPGGTTLNSTAMLARRDLHRTPLFSFARRSAVFGSRNA